ncbi:DUF3310 domain-containing protein [Eggerthellaceae bacterium zg-893]|nr:DUF3310 domain-containing protein [Eggerthellaceae bacterium zg-893]
MSDCRVPMFAHGPKGEATMTDGIPRLQAKRQDDVSNPSHYAGDGIECKDALRAAMGGANGLPAMAFYWWGCAFKYLWRWRYKGGARDLRKCRQCIDFLMEELESDA